MDTKLEITVKNRMPTEEFQCLEKNSLKFDDCVELNILEKLKDICIPPIMNKTASNMTVCSNFQEGYNAFKVFQQTPKVCIPPCMQVQVDLPMLPVDVIFSSVRQNLAVRSQENGFYLNIPNILLTSDMVEQYSLISYIAEFGGWTGLLLGVSLVGSYTYWYEKVSQLCHLRFNSRVQWTLGATLYLLAFTAIGYILVVCTHKLIDKATLTDVSFMNMEDTIEDLTISICSLENVYSKGQFGKTVYLGDNEGFWFNASQLKRKLVGMKVQLKNEEVKTLFNFDFPEVSDKLFSSINIPRFGKFIENCHSVDLGRWKTITSIAIHARREVSIYIHRHGQLVDMDLRNGFTIANKLTLNKKYESNLFKIFSSSVSFSAKALAMTEHDGYSHDFSYDDCILQHVAGSWEDRTIPDFLLRPNENKFPATENLFQNLNYLLNKRETYESCSYPSNFILIDYEQNKLDNGVEVESNDYTHETTSGNKIKICKVQLVTN